MTFTLTLIRQLDSDGEVHGKEDGNSKDAGTLPGKLAMVLR